MRFGLFVLLLLVCSSVVFAADEGLAQRGAFIEDELANEQARGGEILLVLVLAGLAYVVVKNWGRMF